MDPKRSKIDELDSEFRVAGKSIHEISLRVLEISDFSMACVKKYMEQGLAPEEIRVLLAPFMDQQNRLEAQQVQLSTVRNSLVALRNDMPDSEFWAYNVEPAPPVPTLEDDDDDSPVTGKPPYRSTTYKSFSFRIKEIKRDAARNCLIDDSYSFYGQWPLADLGDIPVNDENPMTGLLARIKRFREFMLDTFTNCTGVYVGKTTSPNVLFNYHLSKRRPLEVAIMLILHEFSDEADAVAAAQNMLGILNDAGVPVYDRGQNTKGMGSGKVNGSGSACVYAMLMADGPKI